MYILVTTPTPTALEFALHAEADQRLVGAGRVEDIGAATGPPDHAAALCHILTGLLADQHMSSAGPGSVTAVGVSVTLPLPGGGNVRVDESVLARLTAAVTPGTSHEPGILRQFIRAVNDVPVVAVSDSAFHQTLSPPQRLYAVAPDLAETAALTRAGSHGSSHRWVGERVTKLLDNVTARVISCHLDSMSSVCAISERMSQGCSSGVSPLGGLPHTSAAGEFDVFGLPALMKGTGETFEAAITRLATSAGLAALSGGSGDLADLERRAMSGDSLAVQAFDVFVGRVRHYLGAYLVLLGGVDAVAFTGRAGTGLPMLRQAICSNLGWLGVRLDLDRNAAAAGESPLHAAESRVQIWTVPSGASTVIARQVKEALSPRHRHAGCHEPPL